jgi:arylsulfatase A-like enzyme
MPFFLFVNYMDAHAPYLPPKPFDRMYRSGDQREFSPNLPVEKFADLTSGSLNVSAAERDFMISQYDGAITFLDLQIGRLLDELGKRGLYENTMVVITSDHGESFGDHGLVGHGSSLYEDQIHVPLIVKWPGKGQAARDDHEVSLTSLGALIDTAVTARSAASSTAVISESHPFDGRPTFRHPGRAIVMNGLKLIESPNGSLELYDIVRDPGEAQDLARDPQLSAIVPVLRRGLSLTRGNGGASVGAPALSREAEEKLRSLGYMK